MDVLHFDGHGVFAKVSEKDAERDRDKYGKSIHSEILRTREVRARAGHAVAENDPEGIGFLLFEKEDRTTHRIPAEDIARNLFRSKVGLVVLSACQSAKQDAENADPMASVAGDSPLPASPPSWP